MDRKRQWGRGTIKNLQGTIKNFPGLFPLDVSSTLLPGCNSQKMSADITKCPLKYVSPLVENHYTHRGLLSGLL